MVIDHVCFNHLCVNPNHLRAVTVYENGQHRRGPNENSKSGVRGVYWRKDRGMWQVDVLHAKKHYKKGPFKRLEDADRAARMIRNALGFLGSEEPNEMSGLRAGVQADRARQGA